MAAPAAKLLQNRHYTYNSPEASVTWRVVGNPSLTRSLEGLPATRAGFQKRFEIAAVPELNFGDVERRMHVNVGRI